jgi:hypothetical protein
VQIELAFAVGKWGAAFMAGDLAIALRWSGFVSDQLIQRLAIWAREGFKNHATPPCHVSPSQIYQDTGTVESLSVARTSYTRVAQGEFLQIRCPLTQPAANGQAR